MGEGAFEIIITLSETEASSDDNNNKGAIDNTLRMRGGTTRIATTQI
jgi:hypothetical protein